MYREDEVARLHARLNEVETALKNVKAPKTAATRDAKILSIFAVVVSAFAMSLAAATVNSIQKAVEHDRAQRRTPVFDYCYPEATYDKETGDQTHLIGHRISDGAFIKLLWVPSTLPDEIVKTAENLGCPLMAK